jgi:fumarate reductase subunit D
MMSTNTRFVLGVILLVIGLLLPLGAYPVAQTAWPTGVKAAVGGILFFGF